MRNPALSYLALILSSAGIASAGVIAYEPFDVLATGDPANGKYQDGLHVRNNSGTGLSQHDVNSGNIIGFTGQNYSTTNTSLFDTEMASALGVPTTSGYDNSTGTMAGGLRFEGWSDGGSRRLRRSLAAPLTSNTGDVYYFSSIISPQEIDPDGTALMGFWSSQYSGGNNINDPNLFGFGWGMDDGELILRHRTNANTMEDLVLDPNPVAGGVYHIVTKVEVNADAVTPGGPNDTVSVWVNPSYYADEINSPPNFFFDDYSMHSSGLVDRIGYASEGYGTAQRSGGIIFDEPRIGMTYEDVVTFIPEPSRAVLLLMGLGSIFLRRQR